MPGGLADAGLAEWIAAIRRTPQVLEPRPPIVLLHGGMWLSEPSVAARGLDARDLAWAVRQWIPAGVSLDDPGVNPLREVVGTRAR